MALAVVAVGAFLGDGLSTEARVTNDPESDRAYELIEERFPERLENASTELVVVRSDQLTIDDRAFRTRLEELVEIGRRTGSVAAAGNPLEDESLVSPDRHAVLIPIRLQGDPDDTVGALIEAVEEQNGKEGFLVAMTGTATTDHDINEVSERDLQNGELRIGLPAALIILVLVFGALVSAAMPLVLAIVSIVVALGLTALLAQGFELSIFVVNMLTGMGLALGIDYALFVVSRFREERAAGTERLDAIGRAGATASRAVLFSGTAFVLAMVGLLLVQSTIMRSLAVGAILVGIVSVVAALTLLPAVLGLLGDRIDRLQIPFVGRRLSSGALAESRLWGAVVDRVLRRPVVSLVAATVFLIVLALPVLGMNIGAAGIGTLPDSLTSKQGYLALQESFPGAGADPAEVVVAGDVESVDVQEAVGRLEDRLSGDPRFGAAAVETNSEGGLAVVTVPVSADALSDEAVEAVRDLRAEYVPAAFQGVGAEVLVTGRTAENIDYFDVMEFWLPWVLLFVLGLTFVLLTLAFRSVVIAGTAIGLNLLSVGAAYGLLVAVFQFGWGAGLLGFQQVDTVEAWVPLFLFAVLFGLSMDYQVFLLSRIRERFTLSGDTTDAVRFGIGSTARIITGAALIIVAVFSGFAAGDLVMFQQMGFGDRDRASDRRDDRPLGAGACRDEAPRRAELVPAELARLAPANGDRGRVAAAVPLGSGGSLAGCQPAEGERQDAAVAHVLALARRVEPDPRCELDRLTAVVGRSRHPRLARLAVLDAPDRERLEPAQPEALGGLACGKDQRENPHPDQVRAVDSLEALCDDGADAEEVRPFRSPVARRAGAVLLAGEHDQRRSLGQVALRRLVDRRLLARGQVDSPCALALGHELVPEADVGERAAHHHLVVPAAGAVGVEVLALCPVLDEIAAGRALQLDGAGRRDVIGRDRVAGPHETPGPGDVLDLAVIQAHALEVGRPAYVGGVGVPGEQLSLGDVELPPALVAREDVRVSAAEHLPPDGLGHGVGNLLRAWPEIAEEDVAPFGVLSERLVDEIHVHAPGQRVGHDERRRGKVVRLDLGVDARLEVAVPREHRADDEVACLDPFRDRLRERARVPDAGRAPVADRLEAELVEVTRQSRFLVVLGDDPRARCEAGLHPRLSLEAALDSVSGDQSGGDHHRGVRGIRAARDRGDDHGPVVELEALAVKVDWNPAVTRGRRAGLRDGGAGVGREVRARSHRAGRVAGREGLDRLRVPVSVIDPEGAERIRETTPSPRRAAGDPAGAEARPGSARPSRGRARRLPSTGPRHAGRARAAALCSRSRRARSARRSGPSAPGNGCVSPSTGKKPQVAPYSGDMLPIVARSASGSLSSPSP